MQLREEEEDLVEGQGVRERRRLAAAHVVWVHVCGGVVCMCLMQRRQIKPVCYTAGL